MSEDNPVSLPLYRPSRACRYCGKTAGYQVTDLKGGKVIEYRVCLSHASEVGAVLPIWCENCHAAMWERHEGTNRFLECPKCEARRPAPDRPPPKLPAD